MRDYELIVIGGGPAGITLAKRLGSRFKMAVIRPEEYSMIYCAFPYVIEGTIDIEKTFKSDEHVTDSGAKLIRAEVLKVDQKNQAVELDNGETLRYNKLVIATGANPILPAIKGSDLKGVLTFKQQSDLEGILKYIQKGVKKAVVVGAGAIGIELAYALNAVNVETYLVDMEKNILPNLVDSEMVDEPCKLLVSSGINLMLGESVQSVRGTHVAETVMLTSGKKIELKNINSKSEHLDGIVVFAVGVKPELGFLKDTDIKIENSGIVVDDYMNTSVENIYACGDAVQFKSAITGTVIGGKLATNAVPMARILAENLKGKNTAYKGFYNGAVTKIGSYYIGGTGLTEKFAKKEGYDVVTGYGTATTMFPIMPGAKKIKVKLIVNAKDNTIIGGQAVSGEPVAAIIDLITLAIQNKMTVESLSYLSYSAQPYQSFFPAGNVIVMAAEDAMMSM